MAKKPPVSKTETENPYEEQPPRLVTYEQARKLTSLARTSMYKMVRDGKFPKPVLIGAVRKAFIEAEIHAWIQARIAARDLEAA